MENAILKAIKPFCYSIKPVGSRVTCNPPPMDTDADYLCWVKPHRDCNFMGTLLHAGAEIGGSKPENEEASEDFVSYTVGELNIIATCSQKFHHRFLAASSVAKRLNLMDKAYRIALFQAVLYGNF